MTLAADRASSQGFEAIPAPLSLDATGLDPAFVADLTLKHLYRLGQSSAAGLAEALHLPHAKVIDGVLDFLKSEFLVEVRGSASLQTATFQYVLSNAGIQRARESLARHGYVGPAPVTLADYVGRVRAQGASAVEVSPDQLATALAHLVLPQRTRDYLGPAFNSGRSIFLFGLPGTGKSSIAEALAKLLRGTVLVPQAVLVDQQIIRVFDPSRHHAVATLDARYDRRWVPVARPFVKTGGELTLEDLDLTYDTGSNAHEAPFQVKAAGGVLLIDDFGRQRAAPEQLLNRWIVPLDRGMDFLTLSDGKKIELPFDVLLVFATNRTPSSLVDEAFLRRIQYKIEIEPPSEEEFAEILRRVCAAQQIVYDGAAVRQIVEYCQGRGIGLRSSHPADLIAHLKAGARYLRRPAELTRELLDLACATYFVPLGEPSRSRASAPGALGEESEMGVT